MQIYMINFKNPHKPAWISKKYLIFAAVLKQTRGVAQSG